MVFQGEFSITREKYMLYYVHIKGWFQRKRFQFKVFKYFSRISLSMKCLQPQFARVKGGCFVNSTFPKKTNFSPEMKDSL